MRYRVVETDNFGGDYPDEKLTLGRSTLSKEGARDVARILNREWGGEYASRYWKVVADGYELIPGFVP